MIQLEGRNPVLEAVKKDSLSSIRLAFESKSDPKIREILELAKKKGIKINYDPIDRLDRISQTGHHQGIIGYGRAPDNLSLQKLLEETGFEICVLLLDGVQDPRNLGAILRTCEATGVDAVVIPRRGSVNITPTVHRVSMGGSIYVPVFERSLYTTIKLLRDEGISIIAIDPSGETDYFDIDLTRPLAFVLGGEGSGISKTLLDHCDKIISIPMLGHLDSLNVSVASSVILYERVRQKYG